MQKFLIAAAVLIFTSCTAVKISAPEKFSSQATKLPVSGLNGSMVNQKLAFGPYQTFQIRSGCEFAFRSLRFDKVTPTSGKETKVFGGNMLTGYEICRYGNVAGIIDILDNNVWLVNNQTAKDKLIVSCISSAILHMRMHDMERDGDYFNNN